MVVASSPALASREPQLALDPLGAQDRLAYRARGRRLRSRLHRLSAVARACSPSTGCSPPTARSSSPSPGRGPPTASHRSCAPSSASASGAANRWRWPASRSTAWAVPATPVLVRAAVRGLSAARAAAGAPACGGRRGDRPVDAGAPARHASRRGRGRGRVRHLVAPGVAGHTSPPGGSVDGEL